jgi:hypothetical protein
MQAVHYNMYEVKHSKMDDYLKIECVHYAYVNAESLEDCLKYCAERSMLVISTRNLSEELT